MNIILLTQFDPFFLSKNIKYLLQKFPSHSKVVATVLFDVSPFGKKISFIEKMKKTLEVFGIRFFIHYGFLYIINKLNPKQSVKKVLKKENVEVIQLQKSVNHPKSLSILKSYEPDLLISIAGNEIFKKPLIELAEKGCLNLHTALLPKYRGIMPSFWVLKNDEKETGVSVFFVDEGIDSGPILVQKTIPIRKGMSQNQLIKESKMIGMDAILEAIELIHKGEYKLVPNLDSEKTYFSFPTRQDVKIFHKRGKRFY